MSTSLNDPPLSARRPRQKAARRTLPPDRQANYESQQAQKKAAGKKSGLMRERRAKLRRYIVGAAYWGLKPAYRNQPYSTTSIDVLREEYLKILHDEPNNSLDVMCLQLAKKQNPLGDPVFRFGLSLLMALPSLSQNDRQILEEISDETLIKDLKRLGVKSRRRTQRSR